MKIKVQSRDIENENLRKLNALVAEFLTEIREAKQKVLAVTSFVEESPACGTIIKTYHTVIFFEGK